MATAARQDTALYTSGLEPLPENLDELDGLYEDVLKLHYSNPVYAKALDRINEKRLKLRPQS